MDMPHSITSHKLNTLIWAELLCVKTAFSFSKMPCLSSHISITKSDQQVTSDSSITFTSFILYINEQVQHGLLCIWLWKLQKFKIWCSPVGDLIQVQQYHLVPVFLCWCTCALLWLWFMVFPPQVPCVGSFVPVWCVAWWNLWEVETRRGSLGPGAVTLGGANDDRLEYVSPHKNGWSYSKYRCPTHCLLLPVPPCGLFCSAPTIVIPSAVRSPTQWADAGLCFNLQNCRSIHFFSWSVIA